MQARSPDLNQNLQIQIPFLNKKTETFCSQPRDFLFRSAQSIPKHSYFVNPGACALKNTENLAYTLGLGSVRPEIHKTATEHLLSDFLTVEYKKTHFFKMCFYTIYLLLIACIGIQALDDSRKLRDSEASGQVMGWSAAGAARDRGLERGARGCDHAAAQHDETNDSEDAKRTTNSPRCQRLRSRDNGLHPPSTREEQGVVVPVALLRHAGEPAGASVRGRTRENIVQFGKIGHFAFSFRATFRPSGGVF